LNGLYGLFVASNHRLMECVRGWQAFFFVFETFFEQPKAADYADFTKCINHQFTRTNMNFCRGLQRCDSDRSAGISNYVRFWFRLGFRFKQV